MKTMKFLACIVLFISVSSLLNAQAFVIADDDKSITCDGSVQLHAESFSGGVWEQLQSTPKTGNAICFINDSIGYLGTSSGVILKTVDACTTWWTSQKPVATSAINAIRFLDKNIGFAVGNMGTLLRTTNGGDTWMKIDIEHLNALGAIHILSPDKIFVTGSGGIVFMSTDRGLTWSEQIIDSTLMLNFNNITFSSPNVGYISCNYGFMFKTVDGGQSWSKQNLPFTNSIRSLSFFNDSVGIAVGNPSVLGNPCVIYKTQNGGSDWFKVIGDSVYENYLMGNDSVIGVNGISLSYTELFSVYFVNEKIVFVPAYTSSKSESCIRILKSIDGGNSWKIDKSFPGIKMYDAYFQGAKNGYVCGAGGFLAKYTATPSSTATFSWYPTTGLSDAAIANPIASPAETTKYYVTSTDNGSTTIDSLTVNLAPLSAMPGADKAIGCEGSVQLDSVKSNYYGSAPLKYRWTPSVGLNNDTIPNPIATVTNNTTYTFSITTPSGCTASDSLTVRVNGLTAAGNDKNIICGGSVTMDSIKTNYSGSSVLRYKWTPSTALSNDTIPNPICSAVNSITYTIRVSSGLEHCAASASVRVNVSPLTVNAGTNKSVACGIAILMDSVSTNYTGTGRLHYRWNPSAGLDSDTIARPTFMGISYTNYTVTVTTPKGCTASDNVAVNVNPLYVNVGADRSGICGSTAQLGIASTNYTGTGLKYKWSPSTGLSNDTIMNPIALVSKTNYTLTISTPTGCSASDNVGVNVIPMSKPSLSYIGVNSNNHNQLYWTKPYSTGIELYNIYKETNVSNMYIKIGSVPFGSEATFVDTLSSPDTQSNKYKITIVEQCGGETASSDYHKTLHLSINKGINTIWNLNWEPYEGFVVLTYNIYRGTTPTNMQMIGSMSGSNTQFSDNTAPTGNVYYQIEAVGSVSNLIKNNLSHEMKAPSAPVTSRSNIASNLSSGVINLNDFSNSFVVFPNPATTNSIYVKTDNNVGEDIQMNIINGLGKIIKTAYLKGNKQQIDISTLTDGLYLMIFNTGNRIGKQKLLIQR